MIKIEWLGRAVHKDGCWTSTLTCGSLETRPKEARNQTRIYIEMTLAPRDIDLFDAATLDRPYATYELMRDEMPVWRDPTTGMYVISRYDDCRRVLLDTATFSSNRGRGSEAQDDADGGGSDEAVHPKQLTALERQIRMMYEEKGWVPGPHLVTHDDPAHLQLRRFFEYPFRREAIHELDEVIEHLAHRLIDAFIHEGRCEWVMQFAAVLPSQIIGKLLGFPAQDLPRIRKWTGAYISRIGLMQTAEEQIASVELEIEAQHYFHTMLERLRSKPDDTVFSRLANEEVPGWGRRLTDEELVSIMLSDLASGGSETTTNAIAVAPMLMIQNAPIWQKVQSDPKRWLPAFVEELLRLESPVKVLPRVATKDVEMHGVKIPAGSRIAVCFAAANRDDERFECPADLNLERKNFRSHLAFGVGTHHCLGQWLARREIYFSLKALTERMEEIWFHEDVNNFSYKRNYVMRQLESLQLGFRPHLEFVGKEAK